MKPQSDLVTALRASAENSAARGIRVVGFADDDRLISYPELYRRACELAAALRAAKVRSHEPVLIVASHPLDLILAFWASVFAGGIPVACRPPQAPDTDEMHRLLAAAQFLVGAPILTSRRDAASDLGFTRQPLLDGRILILEELEATGSFEPLRADPDSTALLLMTSGSSGAPKFVTQTHRALTAYFAGTCAHNDLGRNDISLNWLPLEHVAGLVMSHLRDVWTGCDQIQAATAAVLAQPTRWIDWLHELRVAVTWAPNFAFELVGRREAQIAAARWDLSCVRRIFNGAERIVRAHAQRFVQLLAPHGLPPAAMCPVWGMSETCSAVVCATPERPWDQQVSGDHVAVGQPIPGLALRVVEVSGEPCAVGTVGHLQVRGEMVTAGYYANDAANAELFTADGWLRTGDLALIADGQLVITGRSKDTIVLNGASYASEEFESVAAQVPGVRPTFVAAVPARAANAASDLLAVWFVPELAHEAMLVAERIRQRLQVVFAGLDPLMFPCTQADIPKTGVGKIRRTEIRIATEKRLADDPLSGREDPFSRNDAPARVPVADTDASLTPIRAAIRNVWADILETQDFSDEDNFFDLGGNSLIVSMMLADLNGRLGSNLRVVDLVRHRTVRELARLIGQCGSHV